MAEEEWTVGANRTQSSWRAVGGTLTLADGKVTFAPNAFDRALAGRSWSASLATARSAGREPGRIALGHLFSGGPVDRLRVETQDGSVQLFVVPQIADAIQAIEERTASAEE